jgi:hypothetical protein
MRTIASKHKRYLDWVHHSIKVCYSKGDDIGVRRHLDLLVDRVGKVTKD